MLYSCYCLYITSRGLYNNNYRYIAGMANIQHACPSWLMKIFTLIYYIILSARSIQKVCNPWYKVNVRDNCLLATQPGQRVGLGGTIHCLYHHFFVLQYYYPTNPPVVVTRETRTMIFYTTLLCVMEWYPPICVCA